MNGLQSKCAGGARSKTLDRNPRVLEYDDGGCDDNVRMVTLVKGWAFDDAAEKEGDDPDGRSACHSRAFEGVAYSVKRISQASPCKCGRCLA